MATLSGHNRGHVLPLRACQLIACSSTSTALSGDSRAVGSNIDSTVPATAHEKRGHNQLGQQQQQRQQQQKQQRLRSESWNHGCIQDRGEVGQIDDQEADGALVTTSSSGYHFQHQYYSWQQSQPQQLQHHQQHHQQRQAPHSGEDGRDTDVLEQERVRNSRDGGSRCGEENGGDEEGGQRESPTTPIPGSCFFTDFQDDEGDEGEEDTQEGQESNNRSVIGGMAVLAGIAGVERMSEVREPTPATLRKCQSTHVCKYHLGIVCCSAACLLGLLHLKPKCLSRLLFLLVDFLDHYIDLLSCLKKRQERVQEFKKNLARQHVSFFLLDYFILDLVFSWVL